MRGRTRTDTEVFGSRSCVHFLRQNDDDADGGGTNSTISEYSRRVLDAAASAVHVLTHSIPHQPHGTGVAVIPGWLPRAPKNREGGDFHKATELDVEELGFRPGQVSPSPCPCPLYSAWRVHNGANRGSLHASGPPLSKLLASRSPSANLWGPCGRGRVPWLGLLPRDD